jgi:hypothetical protein
MLLLLQAAKRGADELDKKISPHAANAREHQPRTSVLQLPLRRSASPPGRVGGGALNVEKYELKH